MLPIGEVAHVLQQRSSPRAIIRRQPTPDTVAGPVDQSVSLFRVEVISVDDYEASSGLTAELLPDGQWVSAVDAGLAATTPFSFAHQQEDNRCYATPGLGAGFTQTPMISSPFARNSMGVLWEGSHLSIFANVEGELTTFGFRAGLPRHSASALERLFGWNTGPMTTSVNQGVPGSFANDAIFPYNPSSQALGRSVTAEEAAAFAEALRNRTYSKVKANSPSARKRATSAALFRRQGELGLSCSRLSITSPLLHITKLIPARRLRTDVKPRTAEWVAKLTGSQQVTLIIGTEPLTRSASWRSGGYLRGEK